MNTVHVRASKEYDVLIGSGLIQSLGQDVARVLKVGKAAIISDSNVWPLYGEAVVASMVRSGFHTVSYVFPAGEDSKSGNTYLDLLNFLAKNQLTRSDCLIALGGGVVGDLTGFTAATYLRGIAYVQVPTTLLAAVDSSVGGKTAIDLPAGKNLAGAFYQPSLVVCDTDTLNTLPNHVFRDGCAEVLKYAVLYDESLFAHLEHNGLDFDRETVIAKCVMLKRDVVADDEFDTGARQKLNLGHTFGHSIEAQSGYAITHGQAVAAGMAIIVRAAAEFGICTADTACKISQLLEKFQLPTNTDFTAEELFFTALSDKKRSGSHVNLIVPVSIGNCIIHPIAVDQMLSFIKAGL